MQRMIRQFAAEYTSKNSSTQDSSQPNSTKNQSLLKASLVASSPTAATAQNPVLSKLLMADQDSPLDLTVRKSQSEPSEQGRTLTSVLHLVAIHLWHSCCRTRQLEEGCTSAITVKWKSSRCFYNKIMTSSVWLGEKRLFERM